MMDMELCRTEAIARNIGAVKDKIARSAERAGRSAGEITLLAATKTRGYDEIRAAIAAGIGAAGENRVQELRDKCALGAYDGCPLHFIGPLQTNKVKYLIGNAAMIHSVDSARLAEAISALSARAGVVTDVLIEVNIGGEQIRRCAAGNGRFGAAGRRNGGGTSARIDDRSAGGGGCARLFRRDARTV